MFGIALALPFIALSNDKVTKKAAVFFVFNNYVGPDSSYTYLLPWDMHALVGYLFWALAIAFAYSYFSRFTVVKTKHLFEIKDEGERTLRWRQAYLICVAGGICHNFIDMIFHKHLDFHITGDFHLNLVDIHNWEDQFGYYHVFTPFAIISIIIVVVLFLLVWWLFSTKDVKDVVAFFLSVCIFLLLGLLVSGGRIYSEFDLGTTFFALIWFFVPMVCMVTAIKDAQENPPEDTEWEFLEQHKISIVVGILLILGIAVIGVASFVSINPDFILEIAPIERDLLVLAANAAIGLGVLLVVLAVLIQKRIELGRQISIAILWFLWFMVFPVVLAFFLSEEKIVQEFRPETQVPEEEQSEDKGEIPEK